MYKLTVFLTALFALFIGWIVYKADTGQGSVFFNLVRTIPFGDKIGHFFLYGVLGFGTTIVFQLRGIRIGKITVPYGAIIIAVIAVVEELSQKLLSSRTYDIYDMIASLVGIILFSMIPLGRLSKKG